MNNGIDELLETLNEEQKAAAVHRGSDSLILAGAGSGKTRVLTTKIAYLLASDPGLHPSRILALTFTRKAAEEMRSRISTLVGYAKARMIQMGTFHSVFSHWLRSYADKLGYTPDYIIYDASDSRNLVKAITKELNLDEKYYKPNIVQGIISARKNSGDSPRDMENSKSTSDWLKRKHIEKLPIIYAEYLARCKRNDAMDFDDLLLNMYLLLSTDAAVLEALRNHFLYILVDEYQDTNLIQDAIIRRLKGDRTEITVVGDDAQSIYSFRGAEIDNIIRFRNHFPGAVLFKLTKNYRSTANIVELANGVIRKNSNRIPKEVVSVGEAGEKAYLFKAFNGREEAESVALQILKLHKEGVPYSEIAILYRMNAQSRLLEDELRRARIPNRIYGGISFYGRKEVKEVMAYVRLTINPNDDEAFTRIYNFPARGIGEVTFERLRAISSQEHRSLYAAAVDPVLSAMYLKGGAASRLRAFTDIIESLRRDKEELPADTFLSTVVKKSGIGDYYGDGSPESQERMENIQELISAVTEFVAGNYESGEETPTIERFVQDMALVTDQDRVDKEDRESVSLMTMHGSKGLEFGYVFLPGMEDQIIPSERALQEGNEEEERRLFYVALTRAKRRCILSYTDLRMLHGTPRQMNPSKFLIELDPALVCDVSGLFSSFGDFGSYTLPPFVQDSPPRRFPKSNPAPRSLTSLGRHPSSSDADWTERPESTESSGLSRGDRVLHNAFGKGTVLGFEDSVSGMKVRIEFDEMGPKILILKFAKLTRLEEEE